jgi:hypothetical protein
LELDPEKAGAEWLSEWRRDIEDFVSKETVDACVMPGVLEVPYMSRYSYTGFVDPAGGSGGDSFTAAVAHPEGDRACLDAIVEVRSPFSPEAATERICEMLRRYRITKVTGDRYAGDWPKEQFLKRGIIYEASERTKSDIYRELLPLINARRCDLLDNKRMLNQLCSLERRTGRGTGVTVSITRPVSHPATMQLTVVLACLQFSFPMTVRVLSKGTFCGVPGLCNTKSAARNRHRVLTDTRCEPFRKTRHSSGQ